MNSLSVLGKYLDQPRLVKRFSQAVPAILIAGGAGYTYNHVKNTPQKEKPKELKKSIIVMSATILSALIAPKASAKIAKLFSKQHPHECCCHHEHHSAIQASLREITEEITHKVDEFLAENIVSEKSAEILNKAKERILKPFEIKTVFEELEGKPGAKEFLSGEDGLIPDPENIDSKHIFGEIGRISILGLFPVLGGILGGISADKATEKDWKERIPDKIKEGSYQYIANIFLCNVGAGTALAMMEKVNVQSKPIRAIGMISGILLSGLVFGSAVANLIGKTFIDPLLSHKQAKNKGLYAERKPEALDAGLHIDDVATVAVMSGLKWIEPALPVLYSISGYRAGIGYRNGKTHQKPTAQVQN
ncbi:MAG: hypothetical protein PHC64_00375 [Candidatus Gastranaerophilales bacterium]|nr:hypothetical protein [Candidatus Gastranaerophilales bacterium]